MVKGDVIYIKECGFFDSFSSGGCGYGPLAKIASFDDLCTLVVFSCCGFGVDDGVEGYFDGAVNAIVVVGGCTRGLVGWRVGGKVCGGWWAWWEEKFGLLEGLFLMSSGAGFVFFSKLVKGIWLVFGHSGVLDLVERRDVVHVKFTEVFCRGLFLLMGDCCVAHGVLPCDFYLCVLYGEFLIASGYMNFVFF